MSRDAGRTRARHHAANTSADGRRRQVVKADTFGVGLAVMVVCAIVLGRLVDPAWVSGFLAVLMIGAGACWEQRKRPDALRRLALLAVYAVFALSAAGTLLYVGWISSTDLSQFWASESITTVSQTLAALLLCLSASSGLLYLHHRRQGSYTTLAEIIYLACFGISACNLLWVGAIALFS
jgi:drug/metabolite transporter (DMT)-like permease